MASKQSEFEIRLAESEQDQRAAQRLRYRVFVEELGGDGALVDHDGQFERDRYDPFYDHMILVDPDRDAEDLDHVVGVYRLMLGDRAEAAGGFYCSDEYDLALLQASGRRLLELGRSCLHEDYRGGTAMFHIWNGIGRYVVEHDIEIMFGVASFHGTDVQELAQPLSFLYHNHLAPETLRVRPVDGHAADMNLLAPDQINRLEAVRSIPALMKAYLRLGGCVGDGAFIDHAFNTTDVMLIMETEKLSQKHRALYSGGQQ